MWHEARKQEKKIRGMLVDYRKRAERRQDFYERIKADPTQFLQVHGRKGKIHLDASVATAAENPAIMMPWQGQKDNLIDRFDVRAHLDYIPPVPRTNPDQPDQHEDDADERAMNYERYRVLAQNEFLGIVEEKYLHQLYLEEQFGVNAQIEAETKAAAAAAKKKSSAGAAIGYTYEETETVPGGSGTAVISGSLGGASTTVPFAQSISAIEKASEASASISGTSGPTPAARFDECMKDDSDSDLDMDVSIDINKIGTNQAHELNTCGRQYGMKSNDFYSFLTKDADEADALRMAREEEQEKIMFSGRKSRRERRAQRERKVAGRPLSPPSYAAKEELVPRTFVEANDSSRSPSPVNSGKITYITSFGGEEELQPHGKISFGFNRDMSTLGGIAAGTSKAARMRAGAGTGSGAGAEGGGGGIVTLSYADKVKQNLEKLKAQQSKESDRKPPVQYQRSAATGGRGRSSRSSSSSSSSRSRSRSRRRRRTSSSSRSRSRDRSRSKRRLRGTAGGRSRSRSRSGGGRGATTRSTYSRYRRRSKSKSRSRSRSRSHSRTQSKSSRWSPRRRYPSGQSSSRRKATPPPRSSSSSSSSSSTSSRSRSRSRTPSQRTKSIRPTKRSGASDSDSSRTSRKGRVTSTTTTTCSTTAMTTTIPIMQDKKIPPIVVPHAILGALPPPPPPPPIPTVVRDENKPIPALVALIEPEPEVPIKRYYGRRRGDESSSDEASSSGEDTNGADTDRKPNVAGLLSAEDALSGGDAGGGGGDETADTTGSTGSIIKSSGTFDIGLMQIKQEKLEPIAGEPQPIGDSASLRFGKTVTGGTNAPESKSVVELASQLLDLRFIEDNREDTKRRINIGTGVSSTGAGTGLTVSSKSFNPRDRLKRKMQIQLNKQYKADKKAEIEKVERQIQQQQERDDEMRELALKLRRRQRELRHKYGTPESEHSKSHSSEEHSSDEGAEAGSKQPQQQQQQQLQPQHHRFGQLHPPGDGDDASSPRRAAALLVPPLTSVPPPKMALHSRPPPTLPESGPPMRSTGGTGYGNSVVIERKPVLRSATNSSTVQSGNVPPQVPFGGGDIGRLRRRDSPAQSARGYGGDTTSGVGSPAMNLRRGGAMTPSRQTGPSGAVGGRFDDRNRRRSPPSSRYDRSRSKSRERYSARDTGPQGGSRGRRGDYSRSRGDYDRHQGVGYGGGGGQSQHQSGFSGSRYRGRRSRSGSRGRRSRSSERPATRGNGGGGGGGSGHGASTRQSNRSPKPVKKLVDY